MARCSTDFGDLAVLELSSCEIELITLFTCSRFVQHCMLSTVGVLSRAVTEENSQSSAAGDSTGKCRRPSGLCIYKTGVFPVCESAILSTQFNLLSLPSKISDSSGNMLYKQFLLSTLLVSQAPKLALAAPLAESLEIRANGVCGSGIYGELAPILAQYPIAQAFCTVAYPVSCTTAKAKRAASAATTTMKTTSKTTQATSKQTTTTNADAKASAWSKAKNQPGNVVSTMCSCIETPKVSFPTFTLSLCL